MDASPAGPVAADLCVAAPVHRLPVVAGGYVADAAVADLCSAVPAVVPVRHLALVAGRPVSAVADYLPVFAEADRLVDPARNLVVAADVAAADHPAFAGGAAACVSYRLFPGCGD